MNPIDLLIIGAGPAGLSTALHLLHINLNWGKRMLVIEKAAHPRDKLCGGGLTPFGVGVLENLGFPFPLPLPQAPIDTARCLYSGRTFHVKGNPCFTVFNRIEFDHYLAQTARERGVRIHENEAALGLEFTPEGIVVTTTRDRYFAKVVVGADGSKGITRRMIRDMYPRKSTSSQQMARTLEVIIPARQDAAQSSERLAVFDFSATRQHLQGYVWDFPVYMNESLHSNRGIYDARTSPRRPKARLTAALRKTPGKDGTNLETITLKGHPVHCFHPNKYFSAPRILLAGDAAGVELLLGEGIGPALGYGHAAARELESAFTQDDFSFTKYRRHILLSPLGWYLLWRWAAAQVAYRLSGYPWFMHILWTIAQLVSSGYNAVFVNKKRGG